MDTKKNYNEKELTELTELTVNEVKSFLRWEYLMLDKDIDRLFESMNFKEAIAQDPVKYNFISCYDIANELLFDGLLPNNHIPSTVK